MRKIIFLTENMLDQHNENYKEALKYKKRKKESVIAGTAGGVLTGVGATALAAGAVSNPFILLGLLVAGPTMLVIRKFLKDKNKEIEHDLSIEAVGKILKFSKRIKRNVRARPIYNKLIYELQKKNLACNRLPQLPL